MHICSKNGDQNGTDEFLQVGFAWFTICWTVEGKIWGEL